MSGIIIDENNHENFQFFWHEYDAYGVFSQWFDCDFVIEGICYTNAEQYMMAKKALLAGDLESYTRIMEEKNPAKCKKLGKLVKNLDVQAWDACKEEVVYHANLAKFSQNEKALRYLLSTGDKILAEASPYDTIWGIGLDATHPDATCPEKWKGQNLLGKVLIRVRAELRDQKQEEARQVAVNDELRETVAQLEKIKGISYLRCKAAFKTIVSQNVRDVPRLEMLFDQIMNFIDDERFHALFWSLIRYVEAFDDGLAAFYRRCEELYIEGE